MSGTRSRRKGLRFEREVVAELRRIWPQTRRGLAQSRSGTECADVEGTPYWIECKRGRAVGVAASMRQAIEDAANAPGSYRAPVLVHRDDRMPPLVTMRLADWCDLAAMAIAALASGQRRCGKMVAPECIARGGLWPPSPDFWPRRLDRRKGLHMAMCRACKRVCAARYAEQRQRPAASRLPASSGEPVRPCLMCEQPLAANGFCPNCGITIRGAA